MARWFALAIATGALIVSGRNLAAIGTVCLPNRYPVARQPTTQINLKVPTTVAADWKRRAAAAGHSTIRAWLLSVVGTEGHLDDGLTLQSLDRRLCALETAAAGPARPVSAPRAAAAPEAPVGAPDGPLLTADLARRLGRSAKALASRASAGGLGTVVDGWVVTGQVKPPSGGPMRWIWEPVAEG